jgi:prepilin-type processing-associated H-X9-DG protein
LYPPRLENLLLDGDLTQVVFLCPATTDTPAPGATLQATVAALSSGGHESYIYLPNALPPRGNSSVSADIIILYEPLTDHGDGMNVLFSDGRVKFVKRATAVGMIAELKAGFNPPRPGHY